MALPPKDYHQSSSQAEQGLNLGHFYPKKNLYYTFQNHFHPFVGSLVRRLNRYGLQHMMHSDLEVPDQAFFTHGYVLNPSLNVDYFDKTIDLSVRGPYSIYNWELFFHIPLAVAVQLSKNQRFAQAQRWYHFIFDPTTDEAEDASNPIARYWKFKYFREQTDPKLVTDLLEDLAKGKDSEEIQDLQRSIAAWKKAPFSPHTVAKFRPLAYQFDVVMKYIDNLVAWGDSLFRQFTIETINEATQLYILAANILGDRPQEIPKLNKRPIRNYRQLKNKLDALSNAMEEMQNDFLLNSNAVGDEGTHADSALTSSIYGMAQQLYFCIPPNKNLLAYWDLVEDRLFKIRNCMDIEGNVRQLPLFQPPIDPGMLVKAAAAGIDLSTIIGGLNKPVSTVRYRVILQHATDLCNELKNLGNALLSAIEKGDAEKLAQIRQEHEVNMLTLSQDIRHLQWKEAEANTEALLKSRESIFLRYRHYQLILGKQEDHFRNLNEITLDRQEITAENFDDVYGQFVEKYSGPIDLEDYKEEKMGVVGTMGDIAGEVTGLVADIVGAEDLSGNMALNVGEELDLNVFGPFSTYMTLGAVILNSVVSPILAYIPEFSVQGEPFGIGVTVTSGGKQLSDGAKSLADGLETAGAVALQMGAQSLKMASYYRRVQEWVLQNNLAAKELQQIGRQIIVALIREQIAKKDYENHKVQIEQATSIETFLKEQKYSNEELYLWMQGEISKIYYDCYKLAFDTAKKAEVTMKWEMMRPGLDERDFIKFNYWDAGRKGLLSGEALVLDLKRMELAYMESNKRAFEITKHISLNQLNPIALLQLKTYGFCQIQIPEWLFDQDGPGHYMRRIKSVAVSIPAVAGPYTSINCTLSLQKSSIRKSALLLDGVYERDTEGEDDRFRDYYGTIQSIVTSSAQQDSGLFEVNLHDERYLPFENAGAISSWRLELPHNPDDPSDTTIRQFNYDTISDVILHMRYTARQGGALLQAKANTSIKDLLADIEAVPLHQLFSLNKDFPNAWHRFLHGEEDRFIADIEKVQFPYIVQGKNISIAGIELYNTQAGELKLAIPTGIDFDDFATAINHGEQKATIILETDSNVLQKDANANVFMLVKYALD